MTNPPMNWGYPRTKEGFFHALTRGQYDKTNPTDSVFKFFEQVWMYFTGAANEFSLVYLLIALIPFFFYAANAEAGAGVAGRADAACIWAWPFCC